LANTAHAPSIGPGDTAGGGVTHFVPAGVFAGTDFSDRTLAPGGGVLLFHLVTDLKSLLRQQQGGRHGADNEQAVEACHARCLDSLVQAAGDGD